MPTPATLAAVNLATIIFLSIGAFGIVIAAIAMFGGSLFDIGDGLFSTEATATFVGGFGFAAAATYELAGDTIGVIGSGGIGVIIAVPLAFLAARMVERVGDMPTDATPTATDGLPGRMRSTMRMAAAVSTPAISGLIRTMSCEFNGPSRLPA